MPYIGNTAADRFVASKAASVFSGDGSTTAFTLDHSVGSDEDILVSVDGVIQEPSVAYSVSGTTLTFTAAPSSNAGNNIFVYYLFRTVGTVSHPSTSALEATSGTFTSSVGIGTSNPSSFYSLADNLVVGTGSGGNGITIYSGSADSGYLGFNDTASASMQGFIQYNHSGDYMAFAPNGSEKMRIDANGHVTMPSQSAFSVKHSVAQNNQPINTYPNTIQFDTEVFDQNADFSGNTFTAPVTGKYQFNMMIRMNELDTGANYYQIYLITSNRTYYTTLDPNFSSDLSYYNIDYSVLADMDAGDTATVTFYQNNGTAQTDLPSGNDMYFSGYLVC